MYNAKQSAESGQGGTASRLASGLKAFPSFSKGSQYSAPTTSLLRRLPIRLLVLSLALAGSMSGAERGKQMLPHREELAAGIHVAGFSYQYGNANCGWIELDDHILLVDLPRGTPVSDFLNQVSKGSGKPVKRLVLTHLWSDPEWGLNLDYDPERKRWHNPGHRLTPDPVIPIVQALMRSGVKRIITSPEIGSRLLRASEGISSSQVETVSTRSSIGDSSRLVEFIPLDPVRIEGAGAVFLPNEEILFGGPLVFNGTRAVPEGKEILRWISALAELEKLAPRQVVPGFGSWEGSNTLGQLRAVLGELRIQVAHDIAAGYSLEEIQSRVRISYDLLFWTTHTRPRADLIEHVFRELTAPSAPFYGKPPEPTDSRPNALVIYGDSPHPPAPIEEALGKVLEATGVVPHFSVDVETLSAENLEKVQLLLILRDGRQVPRTDGRRDKLRELEDPLHGKIQTWMTLEQEQAVVAFVEKGGGFLNLHNSLGLYPPAGPYLQLVGGRYIGHGAFERFRIEVADRNHPITEGVTDFSTADEQHTPVLYDETQVHLILQSRMDNGIAVPAGWVREVGGGRVCHLASGHPVEPLLHPMYQRLMRNAVEWCLRRR